MKIAVERQGGFAGLRRRGEREGVDLSPEQKSAIKDLRLAGHTLPPDPGADRFIYKVEIDDGGQTEVFRVPESRFPAALRVIAKG
jgi:hypothetical protein